MEQSTGRKARSAPALVLVDLQNVERRRLEGQELIPNPTVLARVLERFFAS
ncbi:MAG: hypothetical protein LBJ87_01850 [bacterium]|jgi:hypothetical protein|nr:hypothetical protein [bacterium]